MIPVIRTVVSSTGRLKLKLHDTGEGDVLIQVFGEEGPRGGQRPLKAEGLISRDRFAEMIESLWPDEVAFQFKSPATSPLSQIRRNNSPLNHFP